MKLSQFLSDCLRPRALALVTLLSALQLPGAPTASELPKNDWHQLWPQAAYEAWNSKPEPELRRLAESGQPAAQFILWQKWRRTHKEEARTFLQAAAKAGLPQAMFEKGFSQFLDYPSPRASKLEGWALMEQAAAAGFPDAQVRVAEYDAQVVTAAAPPEQLPLLRPNLERALDYFRNCAKLKHPPSMLRLALFYSSGIGEPREETESPHNLLLGAARAGNYFAMKHLSDRYLYGHGETVDVLQAARWRCFAWLLNPSRSSDYLDDPANTGDQASSVRDELATLLPLFVQSAEHRDSNAALALARCYVQHGKPGEAVALLRVAKVWGNPDIAAELLKLETTLTPEQKTIADDKSLFPFDRLMELRR